MSNPNPLNATMLRELADELERRRAPRLVGRWREREAAGMAVPAWKKRRELREAFRDEWRRAVGAGRPDDRLQRGQLRAVTAAFRQLDQQLEAALLAADPAAFPTLAGETIRSRVRQ